MLIYSNKVSCKKLKELIKFGEWLTIKVGDNEFVKFNTLLNENYSYLYKTALFLLRDKNDSEDVLQETILAAFNAFTNLEEIKYFRTWITKILINKIKGYYKKSVKTIDINSIILYETLNTDEIEIWDLVDKLKPKYKEVIYLKYAQDLKGDEISEILNCPLGTVKTRISRALCILKKQIIE